MEREYYAHMQARGTGAPLRTVLVDDHVVFREGLAAILANQGDIEVVGHASDAASAHVAIDRERPDVIVMDVSLPGENGLDVTREVLRRIPRAKVLLLTMHRLQDYVESAIAAGATGYALKSQPSEAIVKAIRAVARGELYLPDPAAEARDASLPPGPPDCLEELSRREREIFDLVVCGLTNDDVSRRLFISVKTVETHRARINRKLNIHSTAGLVRLAARRGLLGNAAS